MLEIKGLTHYDEEWNCTMEYIEMCSWKAGKSLAKKMKEHYFRDWERVFIVKAKENICAFATFSKEDGISGLEYSPYIGYIFVDEKWRGQRISERLIYYIIQYAKQFGFENIYIVSDHKGLYEKYGFEVIDRKLNQKDILEKIYRKRLE